MVPLHHTFVLGVIEDGREMLAITTGPDHYGFDGSILVDAIVDYFTDTDWKENTLADMHQSLQVPRISIEHMIAREIILGNDLFLHTALQGNI